MKYLSIIVLMAFVSLLGAAEEVAEVAQSASSEPVWLGILGTIVTIVVTWLSGFLKKKWKAEADKAVIDTNKSLMEQKNFIIDNRLIPFAINTAEHWLITHAMPIIKDATDGDGFHWKDHFNDLKEYLKNRVVKKFASENVDIIEQIGEKELDKLLDRVAIKLISKLPDSVSVFLPDAVVDKLTDKASEFIVEKGKDLVGLD